MKSLFSLALLLCGCIGHRAPNPEPRWVESEYDEGHWECPDGYYVPEVKWAGWTCQPNPQMIDAIGVQR